MSLFDRLRHPTIPTLPPAPTRVLEAVWPSSDDEPLPSGQASWGYRAGPTQIRTYSTRSHQADIEKAWKLYNSNPLAQRIIHIRLEHIIHHDTRPIAKDPKVQKLLDRFWFDPINNMPTFATQLAKDLLIFGTQVIPFSINYTTTHGGHIGDGLVRLSYLDPTCIKDINLTPANVRLPATVLIQSDIVTPTQLLRVVHPVITPGHALNGYLIGTLPTDTDQQVDEDNVTYDGACFLFRINHAINAKFGRSDLLLLETWLDQSAIFFTDLVQHIYWLTNFVWDVKIEGATETLLAKRKNEIRANPPSRGSVLLHNEKEQWNAVTPDLRQEDISSASRTLVWWIAGIGAGIPEHWLGWGRETTRATAKEMQSPTLHMLEERQDTIKAMLTSICRFQIHQAIIAKTLPPDVDQSFMLTLPNLLPPNVTQLAIAFRQVLTALATEGSDRFVDPQLIQQVLELVATTMALGLAPNSPPVTPGALRPLPLTTMPHNPIPKERQDAAPEEPTNA